MIYLDAAATTYPKHRRENYSLLWKNANTPYSNFERDIYNTCKNSIRKLLGVEGGEVILGGCASQLIEHLFCHIDRMNVGDKGLLAIGSKFEHDCVDKHLFRRLNMDNGCQGLMNPDAIMDVMSFDAPWDEVFERESRPLVFCQAVNNITGDVFNTDKICICAQKAHGYFACDLTSTIGKYPLPEGIADYDCVFASSHKHHGEKGTGFMWISDALKEWLNNGVDTFTDIGTPDADGAMSIVDALEEAVNNIPNAPYDAMLRDKLTEAGVEYYNVFFKNSIDYCPMITCLRLPGVNADALQRYLASKEIYIGVGHSACEDGDDRYRVLWKARLTDEEASECIRISFDGDEYPTTEDEIDTLVGHIKDFKELYCNESD